MNANVLIDSLARSIGQQLATEMITEFLELRDDCKTMTLSRTSCGKFIETVVQILQFLDTGAYERKPATDAYLRSLESRSTTLDDGLRICCSRVARACYTLRSKRAIAHKGPVDPSAYDLRFIYSCCQWILSEIVRQVVTGDMQLAGRMVEFVQIPVSSLVEDFGDRKLVYGHLTVEKELLVLLHSCYPDYTPLQKIRASLDRRSRSAVSNSLQSLWAAKSVHRTQQGYKLTQKGFLQALEAIRALSP